MRVQEISGLIKKAKSSLGASKHLLKAGYSDFSASRAYYSMFYAAEAILLTKNLHFSKHSAVISAFGKEFVKKGIFPHNFHRYFIDAFDLREAGDYALVSSINKDKAKTLIKQAKEFIDTIEAYLKKEGYEI